MQIKSKIRVSLSLLILLVGLMLHGQVLEFKAFSDLMYSQLEEKPNQVVQSIDSLFTVTSSISDEIKTRLYHIQSDAYYFLDNIDQSTITLKRAFESMPANYDARLQVEMYNSLGQNLDFKGLTKEAMDSYLEGLKMATEIKDSTEMANLYYNLGLIHFVQRRLIEAHEYFDSCQVLFIALNDSTGISSIMRIQSNLHSEFGELEKSIELSQRGIEYSKDSRDATTCFHMLDIASNYIELNQMDSAYQYIQSAEICLHVEKSTLGTLELHKIYGNYYAKIPDTLKAISHFDSLIIGAKSFGAQDSYFHGFLSKLTFDVNDANIDEALQVLEQADSLGHDRLCNIGYSLVSRKLYELQRYEEAYRTLSRSQDLQDQMIKQKNNRQLELQSSRFRIKEKEVQAEIAKEKLRTRMAQFTNYTILGIALFGALLGWLFYNNKKEKFRLQNERIRNESQLQNEINEIESQALRAQMNPHFIFNALNSIKGLIINKKEKEAALYISKFSKLLRNVLDNSKMKTITVSDDLEVLEMYLKLEQMRFRDGFAYEIHVENELDIDNLLLPPSLIQPFVENAIWHGFKKSIRSNKIDIHVYEREEELLISIEDNGVGREKSQKNKSTANHKSHGIQITRQRINNFSGDEEDRRLEFYDLADEHHAPIGTKVIIRVPMKYK